MMIKFVTFASEIRLNALLCSSAAVLLSACGGGAADQFGSDGKQQTQLASQVVSSEAAASPHLAVSRSSDESAASVTQAGADPEAPAPTPAGAFDVRGYDGAAADADSGDAAAADQKPDMMTTAQGSGDGATSDSRPASTTPATDAGIAAAVPVTAYNYYVAPNGSDSYAGTKAAPFRTLARAARAVRANSTVWVAPGTYSGGFRTSVSGTSTARIYWVSTTKWGARIVPPASSVNDVAWDNRASYNTIVGFRIDGTTAQAGTRWRYGIYNGGSYDSIQENWIHNIAKNVACTSGGGSAIGVDSYYRGIRGEVIGNRVHDIGPTGCHFVQGIYISTSATVKNNVVWRIGEAAIHLWHDANNVIITNNTVTTSGTGIIVGGGDYYHRTTGADNVHVYSNIVYDNKYGISEQGRTGTTNTYRNNLVYQNTYNWTLKNGLRHYNTVSSAPQFVSYTRTGVPNLHLSSSSPAIGRGTSTYAHPTDFDGRPRNSTTGFDIGAYQH
jgi:hypothetical protein